MKIIKKVNFEEVIDYFDKNHPVTDEGHSQKNKWGRNKIIEANDNSSGRWQFVELHPDEIADIWLPYHKGEHGHKGKEVVLIEEEGSTVSDATSKLKSLTDYSETNKTCWKFIDYWQDKDITPIFISLCRPEHIKSPNGEGHPFHLDGVHRLLAWGLKGGDTTIQAFLAGDSQ